MNDTRYRTDSLSRVLQPAALATGLAAGALSVSCGVEPPANIPSAQPKVIASSQSPLLGADKAKLVAAANTTINTYSKLTVDAKKGDTTITVADASATGLNVAAGDLVMVVQMQGATMNTTDTGPFAGAGTTAYGTVTTLNGAGNFEIASVGAVNGNVITLNYCSTGLKNAYTAAAHTQVVRVPQYTTLDVAAAASITAQPWNGDTGGVVAAYVQGRTGLLGNIDASGTGFRGGATSNAAQAAGTVVTTYRSVTAADGGEHGEGIAGSAKDYDNLQGRYGRGAPANGGGGGDSHNAAGGGGANQTDLKDWNGQGVMMAPTKNFATAWALDPTFMKLNALSNSSGGGRGGYTYSANSVVQNKAADPLVTGPGNIGVWAGNGRQEGGGLGGHPLTNSPRTAGNGGTPALFLGGGGGAGNANDGTSGPGGNGGGLVFLVSGSVEGTGAINSKGAAGSDSKVNGTSGDGASGGGGGGTIVVLSGRKIADTLTISADGGNGGSQKIGATSIEAEGPGGGGGGGYVGVFTPVVSAATKSAAGAASGTTDALPMVTFNVNGATFGAPGNAADLYTYVDGTTMPVCVPSDLVVTSALVGGMVAANNTAVLQINITNNGPEPAQAVGYNESLTPAAQNLAQTWTCTGTGGAVCPFPTGVGAFANVADIPVKGSLIYTITVAEPAGFTGPLTLTTGASVPPGFNDLNLNNNSAPLNLPVPSIPTADLAIAMTAMPSPAGMGQPIVYDVTVQNNGPGWASSASFTYTAPAGSTIQSVMPSGTGWTCPAAQGTMVTCTYTPTSPATSIMPGALPDVKITVLPPSGATDIMTSATVTSMGATDPTAGNNTATNDTMIGNFPPTDISVGINSQPNPAMPGAPINYDVRLTNSGPNAANGANVSFSTPAGSTIQSFDNSSMMWQCSLAGTTVNCTTQQNIAANSSLDLMFTVLPNPTAASIMTTATGNGLGVIDSNPANNTATDNDLITSNPPSADLVLTVTTNPTMPTAGQPITYTLDVANKGPADATGADLTYTIPQGATNISVMAPNGWNCAQVTAQNQISCWYNGTIAANTSAPDVVITVTPPAGSTSASATTTVTPLGATDPNPADDTVTTTTSLAPAGDFKLAGGGFGCNTTPQGSAPAAGAGVMAMLLGLLGLRRRRSH